MQSVKDAQQATQELKLLLLQGSLYATFFIVIICVKAIPQPKSYHNFVDKRCACGICNFGDVSSNIPFLIIGVYGLITINQLPDARFLSDEERFAWILVFLGTFLVGFGSGYYHLKPNNERLFWDRTPMCISFAGINLAMVEVLGMYTPSRVWQLAALMYCLMSCYYWRLYDDLRLYLITQFYPIVLAIPVLLTFEARCTHMEYVYFTFGAYLFAKLTEIYDREVFDLTSKIISGHTIKHLVAAAGILALVGYLQKRTLLL